MNKHHIMGYGLLSVMVLMLLAFYAWVIGGH